MNKFGAEQLFILKRINFSDWLNVIWREKLYYFEIFFDGNMDTCDSLEAYTKCIFLSVAKKKFHLFCCKKSFFFTKNSYFRERKNFYQKRMIFFFQRSNRSISKMVWNWIPYGNSIVDWLDSSISFKWKSVQNSGKNQRVIVISIDADPTKTHKNHRKFINHWKNVST